MFTEAYSALMKAAKTKTDFLKENPIGYFLASILAGVFVGLGILLIFTIGGLLQGQGAAKIVMGASFGIALSLVIMAGAELFTGNNLVMMAGVLGKTVKWGDVIKIWVYSFIGNWVGAIILAALFFGTGLASGDTGEFIAKVSATKMGIPLVPLFLRAVLCNLLVCLAVWSSFKLQSESGKLIMIFWCLFAFITTGFEHSIANMTLLTVSLFAPMDAAISFSGYFYNIIVVSLGNMAGAIFGLAIPYYIISKRKEVA